MMHANNKEMVSVASRRIEMETDVLQRMSEHDHEQVVFCQDKQSGLKAIIAIHSTLLGPALGGVRMWPYETENDALRDVLRLSRGMTYKAAVTGLELGGGKAVIIADPKKDKSPELFEAFGRFVHTLGGRYITAEDVGINVEDVNVIHTQTKYVVGTGKNEGGSGDPSPYTALGVFQGIKASLEKTFGNNNLSGRVIAIQGVGAVGAKLAKLLVAEGARVLVSDIDLEKIRRLENEIALEAVDDSSIYDLDCDVFAPCALGSILNDKTIPRLKCRVIAGGANNQLERREHAEVLKKRGILYAPDYVINAGGLISVFQEIQGYDEKECRERVKAVYQTLSQVFDIAKENNITTAIAADRLVEMKLADARKAKNPLS